MPVNWKADDALDRLFGAIIAAHPGLKLDYNAMATMYGRGASFDAIEGRFRRYRKIAEELSKENGGKAIPPRKRANATPRTPRTVTPRSGVTKSGTDKGRKFDAKALDTPTKAGRGTLGKSIMDAINIETDTESSSGTVESTIKIESDGDDASMIKTGQGSTNCHRVKQEEAVIKMERKSIFSPKASDVNSHPNGSVNVPQNRAPGESDIEMGGPDFEGGNGNPQAQGENAFDFFSDTA